LRFRFEALKFSSLILANDGIYLLIAFTITVTLGIMAVNVRAKTRE